MNKIYTIKEIAEILQVTERTVYTWARSGKLKAIKIGKSWRVTQEALDEFLQGEK